MQKLTLTLCTSVRRKRNLRLAPPSVVVQDGFQNPRQQLLILTWNCGPAATRMVDILAILHEHCPHLLCLQECKLTRANVGAFKAEARNANYVFYPHANGDLGILVQRGFHFVELKPIEGDEQFTLARYGLQIGETRFLVRCRHASPSSPPELELLTTHLGLDTPGNLIIDVGDFNQTVVSRPGITAIWPAVNTYRQHSASDEWCTSIDGAAVSDSLVALSTSVIIDAVAHAQHRPVGVQLTTKVVLEPVFRWD